MLYSGAGKTTLSRFVAWMNGLSVFQIKMHNKYTGADFDDDLRAVLRRSGCRVSSKLLSGCRVSKRLISGCRVSSRLLSGCRESSRLLSGGRVSSKLLSGCRVSKRLISGCRVSSRLLSGCRISNINCYLAVKVNNKYAIWP